MTVCDSASRSITPAQVWQLFRMPCSRSSAGPLPARTNARRCPCTTRFSRTTDAAIRAVHHPPVATRLPARSRPLPWRVLVRVDEREQSGGVGYHAERVEPPPVEIAVVDHAPELDQQRLP